MNQNFAAQRIKDYLQRNGISREDLSQKTGIPQREINSMLAGRKNIYPDSIVKFCIALNTDPNSLLMEPEELEKLNEVKLNSIIVRDINSIIATLTTKNLQRILFFARGLRMNDQQRAEKNIEVQHAKIAD